MRSKKLLSLILVLCIVLPLLPVFATDSTEPETTGNITYIINDTFDEAENLGNWQLGNFNATTGNEVKFAQEMLTEGENSTGVMTLSTTVPTSDVTTSEPFIYNDFDDVNFSDVDKIVIETRVKTTGGYRMNGDVREEGGRAYLRMNRPHEISLLGDETNYNFIGWAGGALFEATPTSIKYKSNEYGTADLDEITSGEWVNVRIIIDSSTALKSQKYTMTTWADGDVANAVTTTNGILKENKVGMYDPEGWKANKATEATMHTALRNLTFTLRNYSNTLDVDYIRAYVPTPVYADAQILGGSTVEAGKTADIQFINVSSSSTEVVETKVGTVPEGAVTITNAAGTALKVVQTYDADNQIVSVKPEGDFVKDETYTIALNETALSSVGLTCGAKSTKSFTVTGRGPRSKGLVINDDFNDSDVSGWVVGEAKEGYTADALTFIDVPGEAGNKALVFSTTATPDTADSGEAKTPNITTKVGNGIEYKEDKNIIIKTRVMNTNAASSLVLKHNRPNLKVQTQNELGWNLYTLFRQANADTNGNQRIRYGKGIVATTQGNLGDITGSETVFPPKSVNKWVEYTIEINGKTNAMSISATLDDDEGNSKTYTKTDGSLLLPTAVYEKEYGKGTAKTNFDALDTLSFIFMNNASTAYIDYIQVYEEDAFATAAMSKTQYKKGEAPAVVFTTDMELTAIPDGAVTTEGFEATPSFDATSKTLTLTPNGALKAGTTYTVKLDKAKLEEAGMFYTGAEELKFGYIGSYAVYDTFDTGTTEGWEIGVNAGKTENFEYGVKSIDGRNALMIKNINTDGSDVYANVPNYIKDFDDITFVDGEKVIIEATVMQTGDIDIVNEGKAEDEKVTTNNGIAYLKYNRPNVTSFDVSKELGANYFTLARFNANGYSTWTNNGRSSAVNNAVDLAGKWIKFKIEIDGKVVGNASTSGDLGSGYRTMKTTYTIDGKDNEYSMWLAENTQALGYAGYTASEELSAFPSLSSLTFLTRRFANELYIDEIKVSVLKPFNAQAQILGGSTVEAGKEAEIQFINVKDANEQDVDIDELPEGAVTINGTAAVQSWDAESKTVSVKPADGFVAGTPYTIALDTDVLSTIGMTCTGTKTFTVTGRGPRSKGLVINDDFNDSDVSGWVVGEAAEGYTADELTFIDVPGEAGNKALVFSTTATPDTVASGDAKTPNITTKVGNGIEYKEDKNIIIKTRVMNTNADSSLVLKHNRPNLKVQTPNELGWNLYTLFRQANADTNGNQRIRYGKGIAATTQGNLGDITGSETVFPPKSVNKWVEYTIEINGKTNAMSISATLDDDEGNSKTYTKTDGSLLLPTAVYEKEYGKGTAKTNFDALDTLSFIFMNNASTAYIDYIQVYEEDAFATAAMSKTQYKKGEVPAVVFDTDMELTSIPEGAVTTVGFEAQQSFADNILTLTPEGELTTAEVYTVKLDADKLAEAGIIYNGAEELKFTYIGDYIVYDTFDNDLGGWVKGAIKEGTTTKFSLDRVTLEDADNTTALALSATKVNSTYMNEQPTAYLDFDDIEFTDGKKIVIETKFKQQGDESGNAFSYLKYNRPNVANLDGTIAFPGEDQKYLASVAENASNWYTMLRFRADVDGNQNEVNTIDYVTSKEAPTMANADTTAAWTDVKIVIDGEKGTYSVTTKTGDAEAVTVTDGALKTSKGELQDANATVFTHDSLDSLTLFLRNYAQTLYVDYFRVYEVESYDVTAILADGNTVEAGGAAALLFDSAKELSSIPVGAVKVDGENAEYVSFENNILSVKPASGEFEANGVYTITVDADILATELMDYIGQTSFTVTGRGTRETTGISDNFAGDKDSWYEGASADGYSATATAVADDGAKDGNALKIEFPARGTTADSQYGSVTKKLGNGIEFKDGEKVVIETRVKKTSDDGYFAIKLNRPDTEEQLFEDVAWPSQYALLISYPDNDANSRGAQISQGIFSDYSVNNTYTCPRLLSLPGTGDFDFINKWVTYKMVLDYEKKKIYTTVTYTDGDKEVTLVDNNTQGEMMAARWDLDAIHGKGAFDILEDKYYTSLDRITFTSINDCDIYVDYVNVYTTTSIDEKISAKLTTDGVNGIDSFAEGDTVKPVFELHPKDEAETTYYAISAKYVDGKLADKHIEKITTTGKTHTDETGYTIGSEGNVVIKAFVWSESFVPLCTAAEAESEVYTVYVRTNGDDNNGTGANNAPVASLEKALELVYASNEDAAQILIGEGDYKVEETITIPRGAKIPDGGLTIKNETSNKPVFVGGNTYTGDMATLVDDADANFSRLSKDAQGKVYKLALGTDAAPISYPGTPDYSMRKAVNAIDESEITLVTSEVAFDEELGTIARWPNIGEGVEINGTKIDYAKTADVFDPVTQKWVVSEGGNSSNIYAAKNDFGPVNSCDESKTTYADDVAAKIAAIADAKTKAETGVTFKVDSTKKVSDWESAVTEAETNPENSPLIFGYWLHDWATQTMPLGNVNDANNAVTTKYASWYGAKADARYYVFNLLEELDTAGEYYIDRSPEGNDVLYFYSENAPTASNIIKLSTLDEKSPMLKVSTENEKVVIDGLIFESSRGTGIALSGSIGAEVKNCVTRNLGSYGISVYASESKVHNNKVYNTNGGIVVNHKDQEYLPHLTKSNNNVYDNEIYNYSRLNKVYIPAFNIGGVNNTVSHNYIHGGEHYAVSLTGYNNVFEYNEITDVLNEVGDAGAVYMGRSWANRGNKVKSNYIHDIKSNIGTGEAICGVYMDDHYAGVEVSGNVFKNIPRGIMTNRGREQTITNNLFINCGYGFTFGGPNYDDGYTIANYSQQASSLGRIQPYFANDEWIQAFPELCEYGAAGNNTDWGAQQRVIIKNNVTIGGNGSYASAYAAAYTDPNNTTYNGQAGYLNSDVSNNGTDNKAAVKCGTTADNGADPGVRYEVTPFSNGPVSDGGYADVVADPAAATADRFADVVPGFVSIDWANIRH